MRTFTLLPLKHFCFFSKVCEKSQILPFMWITYRFWPESSKDQTTITSCRSSCSYTVVMWPRVSWFGLQIRKPSTVLLFAWNGWSAFCQKYKPRLFTVRMQLRAHVLSADVEISLYKARKLGQFIELTERWRQKEYWENKRECTQIRNIWLVRLPRADHILHIQYKVFIFQQHIDRIQLFHLLCNDGWPSLFLVTICNMSIFCECLANEDDSEANTLMVRLHSIVQSTTCYHLHSVFSWRSRAVRYLIYCILLHVILPWYNRQPK